MTGFEFSMHLRSCVALVALCWFACTGCTTNYAIGHHPKWRKLIAAPQDFGLEAQTVHFVSTDGLHQTAWWLPAVGKSKGTVILAHGQGGNRSHMLRRAALCVRNGYNALDLDLRAHGESEGNYMTPGYKEALDVLGALDYLHWRGETGPIVLFGYSYGAVAVLHAAAQSSRVNAVIADAAFIFSDMMDRLPELLAKDPETPLWAKLGIGSMKLPGLTILARIEFYLRTGVDFDTKDAEATRAVEHISDTPVLFIAGEKDTVAPPEIVQQLYELVPTEHKRIVVLPGATHQTLSDETQDQYEKAVLDFLDRHLHEIQATPSG